MELDNEYLRREIVAMQAETLTRPNGVRIFIEGHI